jgi:hypothetical protein
MFIVQLPDTLVRGKIQWVGRDSVGKQPVGRITVTSDGPHKGKKVFVYLADIKSKVRKGDELMGEIHQNGKKNNGRTRFLLKKPQLA